MKRIVILGGGTGGSIMMNKLAHGLRDRIKTGEVEIVVVNPSERHYYQPAFLLIPVNVMDEREAYTPFSTLVPEGVKWIRDRAVNIDLGDRTVRLGSGEEVGYDYLVVATGASLDPSCVRGLEDTHHFYSFDATRRLKRALADFEGGKVVVGISSIPYRCPPAPIEMTLILRDYFVRRGIWDKVELTYFYPLPRVFPIEGVAELLAREMDRKGIHYSLMFNLDYVDTERKRLVSLEGEELEYDLAIIVPPHRVADFEAEVVSKRIMDEIEGYEPTSKYNGKTMCFVLTGIGKATVLVFDYENPPPIVPPSFIYYWLKLAYNKLYWNITAKSILSGVVL